MQKLTIITGVSGSGKTTHIRQMLEGDSSIFVVDDIRGLNPELRKALQSGKNIALVVPSAFEVEVKSLGDSQGGS